MGPLLGERDLIRDLAKKGDKEKSKAKNKGYRETDLDNCPGVKDRCLPRKMGISFGMGKYDPFTSKLL